jgi:type I restriction enzyme S subunit
MRLDEEAVKRIYQTPSPSSKYWLKPGDLLVQRGNTIEYVGAAAICDGPANTYIYPDLMMRVRINEEVDRRYVWRYLNSERARRYFQEHATGTAGNMPKINSETLKSLPIALPKTIDERREVLRGIDTAFAWVDRLALETTTARTLIDYFDQAILTKAFRGELVPQDPNDEPAKVLLERIRAQRQTTNTMPSRKKQSKPGRGRKK